MIDPSNKISTPQIKSAVSLLNAGDLYSGAYNFMSSISAGVDPRTGAFSASVNLPTGAANDLRGPYQPFAPEP